jgi:homopolymeric O-antigen transport system ATP-binding protein
MTAEIEVRGLSKAYTIQHDVAAYGVLRDQLGGLLTHPLRTLRGRKHESEEIWALRDVSFDVAHGDVLGVIGRNGSGKSTLLKILSRIVTPTAGHAVLRGKVASLLEVGTGFHAELSGRENVYLNGAILGLSRRDIDKRFDRIVEFSEIPKFLDTPVKFYSSGMYVRLAFAVAAHLDPDVLIVDEVLSVGDAGFQKKSLDKMREVAGEGRTVLFVSHAAESVLALCTRGIHLSGGRVVGEGTAFEALESYREELDAAEADIIKRSRGSMSGATITRVRVRDDSGATPTSHHPREPLVFEFDAEVEPEYRHRPLAAAFGVDTESGGRLLTVMSTWVDTEITAPDGTVTVRCEIPNPPLGPGRYRLSASLIADGELINAGGHGPTFEIDAGDVVFDPPRDSRHGPVLADFKFEAGFRHRREVGGRASVSGHPRG